MLRRVLCFAFLPVLLAAMEARAILSSRPVFEMKAEWQPATSMTTDVPDRTRYVFSRVDVSPPEEIWSLTRPEQHLYHWISPSGRVWVAARKSFRLNGPAALTTNVWTRNAEGDAGGSWSAGGLLPSTPDGNPAVALDFAAARIVPLPSQSTSEQLRLPLTDGREFRFTVIDDAEGAPIKLSRMLAKGERDLLTETIELGTFNVLQFSRPVPRSPLVLWQGMDRTSGKRRRILQNVRSSSFLGGNVASLTVESERELTLAPALAARTPGGRILWFGFSGINEPDAARLSVTRLDGTPIADLDLVALGGYEDSRQARAGLHLSNLWARRGEGWVPMESAGDTSGTTEEILIQGDGLKVLVTIGANGAEARRVGVSEKIWAMRTCYRFWGTSQARAQGHPAATALLPV